MEMTDQSDMQRLSAPVDPLAKAKKRLEELADQLRQSKERVAVLEQELKTAQRDEQELSERMIPDLMEEIGFTSFKTKSGLSITIEEHVHASITEENRPRAYGWMDAHGCGGMIKRSIEVAFNKDQADAARKLETELRGRFPAVKENMSVHSSTLRAWVKRRREAGEEIPESISVHTIDRAEISKNK